MTLYYWSGYISFSLWLDKCIHFFFLIIKNNWRHHISIFSSWSIEKILIWFKLSLLKPIWKPWSRICRLFHARVNNNIISIFNCLIVALIIKRFFICIVHIITSLIVSIALHIILTIETFAFTCAWYISFIAFTIFLLAKTSFAFAAFKVLGFVLVHFVLKCHDISLQDFSNSSLSLLNKIWIIVAGIRSVRQLLALTRGSTCCFVTETLAI